MRISVIAACAAIVSSMAFAAGSFDGEWKGEMVAASSTKDTCGFSKTPFRIVVTDREFVATGTDGSDNERTFDGDIDDDGSISVWGAWRAFGFNNEAQTQSTKLTGQFVGSEFTGSIAWTSKGLDYFCGAKISLRRAS